MFLLVSKHWRDAWLPRRLATCDYKAPGEYFVTICTSDRAACSVKSQMVRCNFPPRAESPKMSGGTTGPLSQHCIDAFVIMPNHIHGVLVFCAQGPAWELLSADSRPR